MPAPFSGPKIKALYQFEGEQLSVKQVHARVSALSPDTVRRYLQRGICTKFGMLNVKAKRGRNGRGRGMDIVSKGERK